LRPLFFMKIFISSLLLSIALTGCLKSPSEKAWSGAPGAEQYERLFWRAIHDQHWNEVEHHLAPMFVGVSPNGQKFDRAGWMAYWKGHPADVSLGDLSAQPDGADMVLSYEMHLGDNSNSAGVQVVSVWQQLKAGWVLISQSLTPVVKNQ